MVDASPQGGTIERIRMLSGDDAALLPLDRIVLLERFGEADYEPLTPRVIISFTGLCSSTGARSTSGRAHSAAATSGGGGSRRH